MDFVIEYGLFLAKALTILIAVVIVVSLIFSLASRSAGRRMERGHIEVRSLNDVIENFSETLRQVVLNPAELKQEVKSGKKKRKAELKEQKQKAKKGDEARRPRVYVLDFEGDLQASAVSNLREEVTAVLSLAEEQDEVVVRLESPGGQVHGYGLGASQLGRIVAKSVTLTVSVDKVAASGGYMMACIANRIIAAPFALLGSIGVVAQLPNFHRFLQNKDIDFEVYTAGEFKRTVTVFGENTDQGREKFKQELEDVHLLFKEFVHEYRPVVDMDRVATGEAWYGKRAMDLQLCDELKTSDQYLVERCQDADVFQVRYVEDRNRVDRLLDRLTAAFSRLGWKSSKDIEQPHLL